MTFSAFMSNFRTFQVLKNEKSNFRTFQDFSGPVGTLIPAAVSRDWSRLAPAWPGSLAIPAMASAAMAVVCVATPAGGIFSIFRTNFPRPTLHSRFPPDSRYISTAQYPTPTLGLSGLSRTPDPQILFQFKTGIGLNCIGSGRNFFSFVADLLPAGALSCPLAGSIPPQQKKSVSHPAKNKRQNTNRPTINAIQ